MDINRTLQTQNIHSFKCMWNITLRWSICCAINQGSNFKRVSLQSKISDNIIKLEIGNKISRKDSNIDIWKLSNIYTANGSKKILKGNLKYFII